MHQNFQTDLVKLRHKTLDTYVKLLKIGNAPQNYSTTSKIKLACSLQGLGPNFKLLITVDNAGDEVHYNCDLLIEYDKNIFKFSKEHLSVKLNFFNPKQLGVLIPNAPTKYAIKFRNISQMGNAGNIKVYIVDKDRTVPLITSTLKVPISEFDLN